MHLSPIPCPRHGEADCTSQWKPDSFQVLSRHSWPAVAFLESKNCLQNDNSHLPCPLVTSTELSPPTHTWPLSSRILFTFSPSVEEFADKEFMLWMFLEAIKEPALEEALASCYSSRPFRVLNSTKLQLGPQTNLSWPSRELTRRTFLGCVLRSMEIRLSELRLESLLFLNLCYRSEV